MRKYTAAQKQRLMTKLLANKQGRRKLAATMVGPLRQLQDYVSIGRRAFMIDELPDGALPIYDKDVDLPAYVVAEEGDSIQTVVKGTRLMVPTFEIASLPRIPYTQVKERRFDVLARVKKKARDEIFREEDRKIFAAIATASANNTINTEVGVAKASFNMGVIADAFANIERNSLRVDKVFINPDLFPVFRKAGRDYLDFETQRELLKTGLLGVIYGASIYQSPEVPPGCMYLVAEPEYFGVMPIRNELTVLPADDPATRQIGWSIFEAIGIGIHNPEKGLQGIKVS